MIIVEASGRTATLLFSDIEGSTHLLKGLRERYGEVLAEHQRILRAAFAAHGGEEVDTQGDSFFVAFRHGQDAVLAAADAQVALAAHSWPEGGQVQVRIGIHTGEIEAASGGYVGVAVHRAARICAAAHGGQVLVSETTKALLEGEEVELPGLGLRDLGEWRLKDFDRPIALFQLVGVGLADDFPPPRTLVSTPLAGREEELAQTAALALRRRYASKRLVLAALVALVAIAAPVAAVLSRGSGGRTAVAVQGNSVAVIDPKTNAVVGDVAVGTDPAQLVYSDGRVWVANSGDLTLSRISARTLKASPPVGVAAPQITDLAAGFGSVWIADGTGGSVLRFDPTWNRVVATIQIPFKGGMSMPSGGKAFPYVNAVAVGEGGVWALEESQTAVFRIDPHKQAVDLTIPKAVVAPMGSLGSRGDTERLAVGLGSVWAADPLGQSLNELSPALRSKVLSINLPAAPPPGRLDPSSLAVGGGAVWLTSYREAEVWLVDIGRNHNSVTETIPVGRGALGLAVDRSGVWVANSLDGTVTRVDPQTNKVVATIKLGHTPSWVAIGGGRIWVSVQP